MQITNHHFKARPKSDSVKYLSCELSASIKSHEIQSIYLTEFAWLFLHSNQQGPEAYYANVGMSAKAVQGL